jgi:hypothetical protein
VDGLLGLPGLGCTVVVQSTPPKSGHRGWLHFSLSQQILQINFTFSGLVEALGQSFAPAAQPIADTPGLRWKIWLINEGTHEGGGIYLFDDEAAVQAYLAGPIVAGIKEHPALSNISVKQFGVLEEFSAITRGPVRTDIRV